MKRECTWSVLTPSLYIYKSRPVFHQKKGSIVGGTFTSFTDG